MGGVSRRLVAIVIVVAGTASAQQSQGLRDRDPDIAAAKQVTADYQKTNFHYDAFYLSSHVRLSNAGYSSSFSLPAGTATTSERVTLGIEAPHRLYFVPRRKTIFTVDFTPAYAVFNRGNGSGQFDYQARADAHLLTNHLYIDAYVSLIDQLKAHVADFNRLATLKESEYGLAGEFKYSSRTSAIFSLRRRGSKYPDGRYQPDGIAVHVLDRTEDAARVALHHKTFPVTSTFIAVETSDYEFDQVRAKESRRTYAGAGFLRDVRRTAIRVEAGPARLRFVDPGQADYTGIIGSITSTRTNGRWNFAVGGARDIGFAIFLNNPYYEQTTANAGVNYAATRKVTFRGIAAYERDDYPNPVEGHLRTDTIKYLGAGFNYNFWKLGAGLDIGYLDRDTTYKGDVDSGLRWALQLVFTL